MMDATCRIAAARPLRKRMRLGGGLAALTVAAACSNGNTDACALEDADGIIGGEEVFFVRITDSGFEPPILAAQNQANVTLTVTNESSDDAGFFVDCLPTRNDHGCAQQSCFPEAARVDPIAPGESATIEFEVPEVEGEYTYRALPDGDDRIGQFVSR